MVPVLLSQVGWSSTKNYHTFVWALAPSNYKEGTDVNCCVHFQGDGWKKQLKILIVLGVIKPDMTKIIYRLFKT